MSSSRAEAGRVRAGNRARFPEIGWMGDRLATGWPGTAVPVGSLRISAKGAKGASVRSRLPQHEIPSKYRSAVPPGSARSLRGQCPIPAASARDSRQGWCYSTSGIGPLPSGTVSDPGCLSTRFPARMVLQYLRDRTAPCSSRLPQHEIPSKGGSAVPPGSDRSLRPILWQGSSDSSRDSRVGRDRHFPGTVPPGSARSLRFSHGFSREPNLPAIG